MVESNRRMYIVASLSLTYRRYAMWAKRSHTYRCPLEMYLGGVCDTLDVDVASVRREYEALGPHYEE